jgi:hypothetical protein
MKTLHRRHPAPTIGTLGWMAIVMASVLAAILTALMIGITLSSHAQARWKAEYASAPKSTRDWYERQTTTAETRKRINAQWYISCCLHADTVNARFAVSKLNGADRWFYQIEGTTEWREVPADAVQPGIETPHEKPVLFVDATGREFGPVCFFPGVGGI